MPDLSLGKLCRYALLLKVADPAVPKGMHTARTDSQTGT
jgi:hypothetical protein